MKSKKVVLQVQIDCVKCRRTAMDLAAKHGADSVAMEGKDILVVRGDDGAIDPANLAIELRKKLGRAKIVSVKQVTAADDASERKDGEEVNGTNSEQARGPDRSYCYYSSYRHGSPSSPPVVVVHEVYDSPAPSCSVM